MNEKINAEVVNFNDVKRQILKKKVEDAINGAKNTAKTTVRWVAEHPSETVALVTSGALLMGKLTKYKGIREDRIHRDQDFYDRRACSYSRAKRKPTFAERREIERRYANGERYSDILFDMRLNER